MITKNYPTRKGTNYEVFARDNPLQPVASLTVFCPISSETLFLLSYNFYTMVLLDKAFLNNLEW